MKCGACGSEIPPDDGLDSVPITLREPEQRAPQSLVALTCPNCSAIVAVIPAPASAPA
jgi:hypothetical protein